MDLRKEVAAGLGEEVGGVLDVRHEEVLGEDSHAGGVVQDVIVARLGCALPLHRLLSPLLAPHLVFHTDGCGCLTGYHATAVTDGEASRQALICMLIEKIGQGTGVVAGPLTVALPARGRGTPPNSPKGERTQC